MTQSPLKYRAQDAVMLVTAGAIVTTLAAVATLVIPFAFIGMAGRRLVGKF
jgi:hypothetical protein